MTRVVKGRLRALCCGCVALMVAMAACGRSEKVPVADGSDTAIAGGVAGAQDTSTGVVTDTACVLVGAWSECKLMARLETSGLAPRRSPGAIRQPFLSVPGFVIAVGGSELQAYVYPDTLALQRDFERLDTARVAPPTMQVNWRSTPNLIRSNNVLAILLSNDETQIERVRNAITAGLPAAKSTP